MDKIEASVTVGGVEYTATMHGHTVSVSQSVDPSTGRSDGRAYSVGDGRWDGSSIVDCGADLGDEVWEALDEALSDAIEAAARKLTDAEIRTLMREAEDTGEDMTTVVCTIALEGPLSSFEERFGGAGMRLLAREVRRVEAMTQDEARAYCAAEVAS